MQRNMAKAGTQLATVAEGVCGASLQGLCRNTNCQETHLPATAKYYDAHCHLDRLQRSHRVGMSKFALPSQFAAAVTNFIDPQLYQFIPEILEHPKVYGTIGVHPQHADKFNAGIQKQVERFLKHPKIVAVGETGLDVKHLDHTTEEQQRRTYQYHLDLAKQSGKPLVLHCRDAHVGMIDMARATLERDQRIHLHCFCGNIQQAEEWIGSFPNLKIGLTNLVSSRSVSDLRYAATHIPLDSLLLETDAPYMVPRNVGRSYAHKYTHPGLALNVAVVISQLKDVPLTEVLAKTSANCEFVYGL